MEQPQGIASEVDTERHSAAQADTVVSKTLLLANDIVVTDPAILAQITPTRRAA